MSKIAVVTGMIVTYPVGGVFWDYAQYLMGLEKLGYDVYYLEDTGQQTYDPKKGLYGEDCMYGIKFLKETIINIIPKLSNRWCFRSMDGRHFGLPKEKIENIIANADLFINISGSCLIRDSYMSCPNKILIDSDPGWNHFVNYPKWDENPGWQGTHSYREHNHFFTYAENINENECLLPTMELSWHKTRPLVIMEMWNKSYSSESWTTVMTWNNFRKPIVYEGKIYGTKELEFPKIENIPSLVNTKFEIAVGGNDAPRDYWKKLGWSVFYSEEISKTAKNYKNYIQRSKGEFSVAKNVYVDTRSGWFSCRSICYMAAGKPVVLQDTGFSKYIPTGKGVMAFTTLKEAVEAIKIVENDYETHCHAAKKIAKEYFSHEVVLKDMLTKIGII